MSYWWRNWQNNFYHWQEVNANDDIATFDYGASRTVDVLANDETGKNGVITSIGVIVDENGVAMSGGSVSIVNGKLEIDTTGLEEGVYTVEYTLKGNISSHYWWGGCNATDTAIVTIVVSPAPAISVDAMDDSATVDFGRSVEIDVLANDVDPDGDGIVIVDVFEILDSSGMTADGGSVQIVNGEIVFDSSGLAAGTYTFTYTAADVEPGQELGANILQNGSFEDADFRDNGQGWDWDRAIDGWQVGGQVQINRTPDIVDGFGRVDDNGSSHGIYFIDTDAGHERDSLTQTISGLSDGDTYQFSFDMRAREGFSFATQTVEIVWNGVVVWSGEPSSTDWANNSIELAAIDGDNTLTIREEAGDNDAYGALLDNLQLQQVLDGEDGYDPDTIDSATVTVTVEGEPNVDPVANDDSLTDELGTTFTIDVLANDTDANAGDVLGITSVGALLDSAGNDTGASLSVVNGEVQVDTSGLAISSGSYSFDYTINDGNGGAATATATVDLTSLSGGGTERSSSCLLTST